MKEKLLQQLCHIVGVEHLETDPLECEYFSGDVFAQGVPAGAVVSPSDKHELAAVVKAAVEAGVAVVPRGGGMSYTGGYVPAEEDSLLVNFSRMNGVLELNREDMYITVETGMTWQALYETLQDTGLRTPYWGTLSGRYATIGGGLSQNSIFWGSSRYGSAVESVLGMEIVLADGTILNTGSAAQINSSAFFRHYGPDLTGLFCSDCGALGLKATATFRLVPQPWVHGYGSFAFERYADMLPAMSEISRSNLTTECFGFDPFLQSQRVKRESVAADARQFMGVVKFAGGVGKAIREGAKMAFAGRRFLSDVKWSFHVIIEERTETAAKANLEAVSHIAKSFQGHKLPDSIPRLMRANPFGPVNNMVGPDGERWVPVHGLVPHSRALETMERIEVLFARHAEEWRRLSIQTGYLLATVSTSCFVIEPVFFWPDELMEIHRRSVDAAHLARLRGFERNIAARNAVAEARHELVSLFSELGAAHLQVAKAYPYREALRPEAFAIIAALKKIVDPANRMNPGCLGLDSR